MSVNSVFPRRNFLSKIHNFNKSQKSFIFPKRTCSYSNNFNKLFILNDSFYKLKDYKELLS